MKHSFLFKKKEKRKKHLKQLINCFFRLLFPQHISVFITNNVINNKEIFIVLRCEYTLRMNFTIRE